MRGGFERQHRHALIVAFVRFEAQGNALALEGVGVGLYLDVLLKQAVNGFLCVLQLFGDGR